MKNCPKCNGTGKAQSGKACPACNGEGQVTQERFNAIRAIQMRMRKDKPKSNWQVV